VGGTGKEQRLSRPLARWLRLVVARDSVASQVGGQEKGKEWDMPENREYACYVLAEREFVCGAVEPETDPDQQAISPRDYYLSEEASRPESMA